MKKSFTVKKFVRLVCGGGLLGLISLSLVGVGFSSWLITSKDSPSRDTPLDSIGADGEFSDINQYLTLTKIDSSDFVWNNKLKCFRTSEDEIKSATQGKIDLYFTIDTGSDLIQSHLPSSASTLSVVSDIFSSSEQSKISSCSSLLTKAELIYSSNSLNTSSFGGSTITGTKEEGTWKESFNLSNISEIGKASIYYFAIRYTCSPDNNADFFTSNKTLSASITRSMVS